MRGEPPGSTTERGLMRVRGRAGRRGMRRRPAAGARFVLGLRSEALTLCAPLLAWRGRGTRRSPQACQAVRQLLLASPSAGGPLATPSRAVAAARDGAADGTSPELQQLAAVLFGCVEVLLSGFADTMAVVPSECLAPPSITWHRQRV